MSTSEEMSKITSDKELKDIVDNAWEEGNILEKEIAFFLLSFLEI